MKRIDRYGIKSLEKDFPTEEVCLNFIFKARHSIKCSCGGSYSKLKDRRQYQCSKCRFQIAPTSGTVFHKSETSLQVWFKALLVFSNAKSGISAKELERELEVTYKTAYRMLSQIRKALTNNEILSGTVEVDTTLMGGRSKGKGRVKAYADKAIVVAARERNGRVRARIMKSGGGQPHKDFIEQNIKKGSIIMSDDTPVLLGLKGYERQIVVHKKQFVDGNIHINSVESFFSHIKRSIRGTFKTVSHEHLQSYLDAFAFLWNSPSSDKERFALLLGTVLCPAK